MSGLYDLKVGDVVYTEYGTWNTLTKTKVRRLTRTRIEVEAHSTQYKKEDGYEYGGYSYNRSKIHLATPELDARYEYQCLRSEAGVLMNKIGEYRNHHKCTIEEYVEIIDKCNEILALIKKVEDV